MKPTRRELETAPREALHIARNSTKADVYRLEWPPGSGQFAVLKDMKGRPAWFRLGAGRWFLWREFRALRALDGIEGVPRALAKPDRDCVLMEWRAGTPLMGWAMGTVSEDALNRVAEIVAHAHTRGVVHSDLHRANILLTPEGQVTLIDWATASVFGRRRSPAKNFTFGEWTTLDVRAVAKLKARHRPETLSERERQALLEGSKTYRLIRTLGFNLRRLLGQKRALSPEKAKRRYNNFLEGPQPRQPPLTPPEQPAREDS